MSDREAPDSGGHAWLKELTEQLDSVIQEDPKKRSAGALMIRALIHQAIKGDVRAFREVMTLAQRRRHGTELKPLPRRRGRPSTRIDLEEVQRLARIGMRDLSKVARVLRVPKQTLLGPKHGPAVREAFETGRALFEHDALTVYHDAIAQDRNSPLLALMVKQIGWADRVQVVAPGATTDSPVATMSDEELARFLDKATRTLERDRREQSETETGGLPRALPASAEAARAEAEPVSHEGTAAGDEEERP